MLLVLYGSTAEVGLKSQEYLINAGFELIEKLNCAFNHIVANYGLGERKWVSEEEFYKQTDSLFRYDIGGIRVGFNQEQILDAVSNGTNKLLTMSSSDVSVLRDIKQVYGDSIKIIYCYIDESTLESIVRSLPKINAEEAKCRIEIGKTVRCQYSLNSGLFDYVVIYNGEQSEFNLSNLMNQYRAIIDSLNISAKGFDSYDVFLSYAYKDMEKVSVIRDQLITDGFKVFFNKDFSLDVDAADNIKVAISSSKVFVPIITQNTVKSMCVQKEIEKVLKIADDNAVVIIPVFLDLDINTEESKEIILSSYMQGVVCEDGDAIEAGKRLSQVIRKLLTGLEYLELYSEQVNDYVYIKEYKKALELQQAHRDLCIDLSNSSNGKYISMDAIINSEIKLISILIDMKNCKDALDEVIDALGMLDDDSKQRYYNELKEQFAICCVGCNYSEEEVTSVIEEDINTYKFDIEYFGQIFHQFNYDLCEDLLNEYKSRMGKKEANETDYSLKENDITEDIVIIAQYGKAAMKIFDGLISPELSEQTRGSIIEGYQRVLNYCMQLGLSEQISSECIRKIAELKEKEVSESTTDTAIACALKVFLGQAAPGSGNYDVFVSFKSEDESLARKVYEFLKQNGKEVFFSKETLTRLGESEYEDAIYNAIDHSKHLVLVGSNPEYFKTDWVSREWKYFNNKNRKREKKGNIVIILPGEYVTDTEKLPPQLRYEFEIIRISDFKDRLLSYMR